MTRHTKFALTLALSLLVGIPAAAQITVFADADYRGTSRLIDSAIGDLGTVGLNDRISSLRIEGGQWEICRGGNFRECRVLGAGEQGIPRLESGWNDEISSIRPYGVPKGGAAETLARLLYRGLLGRDADDAGLRHTVGQIEGGHLGDLVRSMAGSPEFLELRRRSNSVDMLDRLYLGLLDRRANDLERRDDLPRVERGELAAIAIRLASSTDSQTGRPRDPAALSASEPPPPARDIRVEASGNGLAHWAGDGSTDRLESAIVVLDRNGGARVDLGGPRQLSLSGSWTRDGEILRLRISEVLGRSRVEAEGTVAIERDRLQRLDIATNADARGDRTAFSFVADGHSLSAEEAECQRSSRERLEREGAPQSFLFLAPERSTSGRDSDQLRGLVLLLSEGSSTEYSCNVDRRLRRVIDSSAFRR